MSARLPVTQINVGPHKSTKAQAQAPSQLQINHINITTHSPIQPNPAHSTAPESGQTLSSCTIYTRVIPLSFRMIQSDRTPPKAHGATWCHMMKVYIQRKGQGQPPPRFALPCTTRSAVAGMCELCRVLPPTNVLHMGNTTTPLT
jgi:hypothetical protein